MNIPTEKKKPATQQSATKTRWSHGNWGRSLFMIANDTAMIPHKANRMKKENSMVVFGFSLNDGFVFVVPVVIMEYQRFHFVEIDIQCFGVDG